MFRTLCVVLLAACAPVVPKPTVLHVSEDRREAFETLTATMEKAARERGVPGGAIAIVENGELAHAAGFGLRHIDRPEGVTPRTVFRSASSGKTLIAATALSLVDAGQLSLDAPIHSLRVTLRQALNHTSGLADRGELVCSGTVEQWLTDYLPGSQRTSPGAVWNYANPNYLLVAAEIEKVTGRRFEDVVKERLFAGLESATFEPAEAVQREHSFMHTSTGPKDLDAVDCVLLRAGGGVMIDVIDFARVLTRIDGQRMLEGAVDIRRGPGTKYGLGVYSARARDGSEGFMHPGGMDGVQSFYAAFPGFMVVAFFNGNAPLTKELSDAVAVYRGMTGAPATQEPPPFEPFVGTFRDEEHALDVEISLLDGTLWADFGNGRQALRWLGGDTFLVKWPGTGDIEATFFPNGYLVTRVGVAKRT